MDFFEYFLSLLQAIFLIRDGKILGKLDMQKTFYFVRELGMIVPFNFRWGKLGPYSYELSNVMNRLSSQGYTSYSGEYIYNEEPFRYVEEMEIPIDIQRFFIDMEDYTEQNNYNWINFIEAAASIHFIFKYSNIHSQDRVFQRISELKTDRMPFLSRLLEPAWDFLGMHNMFQDNSAGE